MLVLTSRMEFESFAGKAIIGFMRRHYARFTIGNKRFGWSVCSDPSRTDGLNERGLLLVRDDLCGVPSCPPVQHIEDDEPVHEKEITLDLLAEGICLVDIACIAGAWLGPLSAHTASADYYWYNVQDSLGNSHTFQEPS